MTDTNQDIAVVDTDPLYGGDGALIIVTVRDSDGSSQSLAATSDIEFEILDNFGGTSHLKKTRGDASVSISGDNYEVLEVKLTPTETEALAPTAGAAYYDWRVRVNAEDDWDTVTTGDICVRAA
jgi:hypothetical protein